ncbi:MAG: type III pantothenate kinase [Lachnospiraceae bacterium]|nr:type III pantothenate kinase [Lachnospiraceae bacterium]
MAKYITIDIGNSSAKAVAWVDGEMMGEPTLGALCAADVHHLAAEIGGKFDAAAICSVSDDAAGLALAAGQVSDKVIEVTTSTPLPIDISAYASTLGADRIAALAAVADICPGREALVVDCGTAITLDRLSAKGEFLGGNISPGVGMRLRAMHAFTKRLPEVASTDNTPLWGLNTDDAMRSGALRGAIAEIEYYAGNCPAGTVVAITGGRARSIASMLSFKPEIADAALVLRGLKHIIEYNEKVK